MRIIKYSGGFSIIITFLMLALSVSAQTPTRRIRQSAVVEKDSLIVIMNLTERAKIKNETDLKQPAHIVWERIVYRQVNVDSAEINAALYYPVTPRDGRQNLYTLLFKLIADNKISAYKYEENESFTADKKVNFEDQLKRQQLLYTKQGDRFVVDDRDIPSLEVKSYMIKEGYVFDQATGTFKIIVLAICPIQVQEDYYGGNAQREPLFWVKYDDVRPYLSREMIMTSNYNNTMTYTFDDYFHKNMYEGDILKTVNMLGRTLAQEAGNDPEALKQAQDSIESQLKAFKSDLWIYDNSTGVKKVIPSAPESKARRLKRKEREKTSQQDIQAEDNKIR